MTFHGLSHLNFGRKLGRMQEGEGTRGRGKGNKRDPTTSFVWVIKIAQLAGVDFRTGHAYIHISYNTHTHKTHIQGITESRVLHAAFWAQAKLEQMKPILIYSRLALK